MNDGDTRARLIPHPDAVLRRVGDGAVLVHLGTSRVFELNSTAARAWELALEGHSKPSIVAALITEYAGSKDAIADDVDGLFQFLTDRGLIVT